MHLDFQIRVILPIELAKLGMADSALSIRALPPLSNLHRRLYRETLSRLEDALEKTHPDHGCLDVVRDCLTELHVIR